MKIRLEKADYLDATYDRTIDFKESSESYDIELFEITRMNDQSMTDIPAFSFSINVIDSASGINISGSEVVLVSLDNSSISFGCITDKDGGCTIPTIIKGNYVLTIVNSSYENYREEPINVNSKLQITRELIARSTSVSMATYSFSINVIDSASGINISGAEIVLKSVDNSSIFFGCITNGNGGCTISNINPGNYSLAIMNSLYENYSEDNIDINANVQIMREMISRSNNVSMSTYVFSINVIDSASDINVSGAEVILRSIDNGSVFFGCITDEDGGCTISNINPGNYSLSIMNSLYENYSEDNIDINADVQITRELAIRSTDASMTTYSFSINVIDSANGMNVSGASVSLLNANDNSISFSCITDEDGGCTISNINPGNYSLAIMNSLYEDYSEGNININANLQITRELSILSNSVSMTTFNISINVINSSSSMNVPDAMVSLISEDDNSMSFSCMTDESGECNILAIKEGNYSISIMASGYEDYTEETININDNLQITKEINLVITWDKTYGGSNYDEARSIVELSGGGFAVAGHTYSKGAGGDDAWILRLDGSGNIVWDKTYGGSNHDRAYSIVELSGGGFAVAGYTISKSAGSYDFWILRLDGSGDVVWDRIYGGGEDDRAYSIVELSGGGFAVAGRNESKGAGDNDFWILRLDGSGDVVWDKTYGGSDDDRAYSIVELSDGGFAVAGYTWSKGAGNNDFWILRLDGSGDIVWEKTYGGSSQDYARSIVELSDGDFAVAGYTYSKGAGGSNFWILRLDDAGDVVWDKTYGGSSNDEAYSIVKLSGGGFAVAGYTYSNGAGGRDFWILGLDGSGNLVWDRTYGGSESDLAYSIVELNGGGFAVAGSTNSKGAGGYDFWVLRLDSEGNLE